MKKMMSLMALAVIGSVVAASAADTEVLSANAVGYVKKTIEPGQIAAIVYPFDIIDGSATEGVKFTEMQIAQDLEGGAKVHFWNGTGWDTFSKSPVAALGWLGEAKNKVVSDGEMFFVQPAATAKVTEYTLAGEVPSGAKTVRKLAAGGNLDAVGFAYPTDQKFVDTDVAKNAPGGSKVHFWNGTGWNTYSKSPVAALGWLGEAKNKVLEAGEGFFIQLSGAEGEWEQVKPYTWP
jgi:hypothetical protein